MKKKEKKLQLRKVKVANLAVLDDGEKKKINGGTNTVVGTTFIRVFC